MEAFGSQDLQRMAERAECIYSRTGKIMEGYDSTLQISNKWTGKKSPPLAEWIAYEGDELSFINN